MPALSVAEHEIGEYVNNEVGSFNGPTYGNVVPEVTLQVRDAIPEPSVARTVKLPIADSALVFVATRRRLTAP